MFMPNAPLVSGSTPIAGLALWQVRSTLERDLLVEQLRRTLVRSVPEPTRRQGRAHPNRDGPVTFQPGTSALGSAGVLPGLRHLLVTRQATDRGAEAVPVRIRLIGAGDAALFARPWPLELDDGGAQSGKGLCAHRTPLEVRDVEHQRSTERCFGRHGLTPSLVSRKASIPALMAPSSQARASTVSARNSNTAMAEFSNLLLVKYDHCAVCVQLAEIRCTTPLI